MHEKQLAFINRRIDEFTKKARLRKRPKLKRYKGLTPASANGFLNRLYVSENFLEEWERGSYEENDVDALLAHEFGHLIAFEKSRLEPVKSFLFIVYLTLLPGILVTYWSLQIHEPGMISTVIMVCWFFFLPWITRRVYVPAEIEADNNAIAFNLADAQQLADALLKRISTHKREKWGPSETLELLWSMLTHPSLYETLQNLGFELRLGRVHSDQSNLRALQ